MALRPLGGIGAHVLDQAAEGGGAAQQTFGEHLVVRADLDRVDFEAAFDRLLQRRAVVRTRVCVRTVPHERLARGAMAQVVAVRPDQVGRRGARCQKRQVEALARHLVQQHVDQRVEERSVGLGLDRHPLRRTRAGHRQVRLDLHALHAAHACPRVPPDAGDAARGLDVGAARDQVIAQRGVRRDDECAVPELAVQMLGVVALDALAGTEAHVDRPPRRQERREGAHVRLRRAGAAEAGGHPRVAGFVGQPLVAHRLQARGDQLERLVPGDRHEAGVLVAALHRIAALHRRQHAIRVVGLLNQPVGLHADPAAAGVHVGGAEVRLHLGRHAVHHLYRQQVGPGDALIAVGRDVLGARRSCGHDQLLHRDSLDPRRMKRAGLGRTSSRPIERLFVAARMPVVRARAGGPGLPANRLSVQALPASDCAPGRLAARPFSGPRSRGAAAGPLRPAAHTIQAREEP